MLSREEFTEQLADAYQHLYDFVRLRTHRLTEFLITDSSLYRKEKALRLHRSLLDVIDELDPGPTAPVMSREWRRYRLMVLRYVDGLDPQTVADELAISRRHYYREHDTALDLVAEILWDRRDVATSVSFHGKPRDNTGRIDVTQRLELLRLEAVRLAQAKRRCNVTDLVQRVLPLLENLFHEHGIIISLDFSQAPTESISIDQSLLRQLLLAILGYVAELATQAVIHISTELEDTTLHIIIRISPAETMIPGTEADVEERLSAFEEITNLIGVRVRPIKVGCTVIGFELLLPIQPECTILIVDDNEDVLELYQRYLSSSDDYNVVVTKSATDAQRLANELLPQIVILDLMMPDQDGWDLMQSLLNQTNTQQIPVVVCSVLRQKELALSLGAADFIQKPVSEQLLLTTVERLIGQTCTSQV